ncbi:MAG: hypothetical protein AB7F89_10965 [Pirellulaceae bacterium]
MDQRVSEQSPVKYRSVLLEMRRDAPPGLNMLYLSGLAETLALVDRENAQEPGSHDLNVRAIARVLRAWGDFEGDTWAGGFVMELLDGRRVYVESYADGPDWGPDSCASVVAVPTGSTLPKLPRNHDSALYGWVEDLSELGDYLRRLG